MSDANMGIAVFTALNIVVSAVIHWRARSLVNSSIVSGFIVTVVFQLLASFQQGHLDSFFLVAFIVTFFYSFGGSLIIGSIFAGIRRLQKR
jgi:hypothetical protein